ncbi:uncharacterized protein LOC121733925 [Aricia agestis]|uniref:uncharacterized protein LOC121733925 n=1 Tax=Aricia agestis TaxID=91739 RepID=UPI001C20254B|nr:uncharacterized protein LOC121733925 [Aricia agestis]
MPMTRSRAASLTRREEEQNASRPSTPAASFENLQNGDDASLHRVETTFTQENMTSIIASLQRSQTEAFRELLQSVRANSTFSVPPAEATLARCTASFSGRSKESVEAFIDAIEAYCECAQVSDANIIRGLAYLLKEDAATWWQGIKDTLSTWRQAKENLISAYGDRRPPHRIYLEIFGSPQQSENTDIFVARIRALLARLPRGDLSLSAQMDITYALTSSRIRERLRREEIGSFTDFLRLARAVEDAFDEGRRPSSGLKPALHVAPASSSPDAVYPVPREPAVAGPAPVRAATRQQPPSSAPARHPPTAPTRELPAPTKKSRPMCVYCKRYGHTRDQCRKLMTPGEPQYSNNSNLVRNSEKISEQNNSFYSIDSHNCVSQSDHNLSPNVKCLCTRNSKNNSDYTYNYNSGKNKCYNSKNVCFSKSSLTLQDTTNVSDNNSKYFKSCMECNNILCKNNECFMISCTPQNTLNINECNNDLCKNNNYCSCNKNHSLGADSLNNMQLKCTQENFSNNFLYHNSSSPPSSNCNIHDQKDNNSKIVNNVKSVFSSCKCECAREYDSDNPRNGRELRPTFKIKILGFHGTALIDTAAKHCIAGHSLYTLLQSQGYPLHPSTREVKLADGVIRIMEVLTTTLDVALESKVITMPFLIFPDSINNETLLGIDFITAAGVVIDFSRDIWFFGADGGNVKYNLCFEPTSRTVSCASTAVVLREDEGAHLTPAERQALADVINKHAQVFAAGGGPTPYAVHRIDTGEHQPIAVPPYRLNPSKKELMRKEIDKMLKEDVIEECESAWCSPALMVPKPNGSIRFCVDYRRLNAITKADTYPMPRIDELVQSTKRNCYMSTLDLRSSYWQISVHEADRDKTAFVCPLGTFRFKRMSFGLRNAPATFQRCIDRFRSSAALKDVTLLGYVDDLLVISEGYQRHLSDLEAVFKRLAEFNLHVNRDKCHFARESVKYLGHVITQDGISTDPDKYTPGKANVVADTLSRPICSSESREDCGICSVICDLPTKTPSQLRSDQIADCELEKNFIPLYHPESNPAERKNRDLKAMLAHLVEENHSSWPKKLPVIRFALNSAKCRTTGKSPAYLSFGREMRSPSERSGNAWKSSKIRPNSTLMRHVAQQWI